MVTVGLDRATEWRARADDTHAVLELRRVGADRAQIGDDGGDAIAFLHAELGSAGDGCQALGARSDASEQG